MADTDSGIDRAREAMAGGAWAEAYDAFSAVDRTALTGRDLEGLADAAWWISRLDESLDARHQAYTAFEQEGDDFGAGAVAARLAIEHFVREQPSVGAGYLMRARRHAEHIPPGSEQGFIAMVESNVARFSGDPDGAIVMAREAVEIGRRFGDRNLIAMAIHTEGLARIDAGHAADGLALLDEAMTSVLAGDLDPYFTGIIYCNLIQACLELNDIRRAGEWSDAARVWCDALPPDAPFPGMCRINRAEVARLRGAWPEAEAEAVRACEELAAVEPSLVAAALAQVGEIRRRTGDLEGAETAFARAHELGGEPQPWLAYLRLSQGKIDAARTGLRLALTAEHQPARRARLLAAQVEAAVAAGDLDEARAALGELSVVTADADVPGFAAEVATADGQVALADGRVPDALDRLRTAVAAWQALRLPYEAARARVLCAEAILAGGDEDGARLELRTALAAFERLGAAPDVAAVTRMLGDPDALPAGLTAREAEVLRLVAAGMTNRDIAVELVISEHTVARHLQNMFAKLGVSSRSAATAFAFEHGLA
ncbi:MAG: LuxR C-terminal-related transcriptional regulator [Actinomycetota bacterium]